MGVGTQTFVQMMQPFTYNPSQGHYTRSLQHSTFFAGARADVELLCVGAVSNFTVNLKRFNKQPTLFINFSTTFRQYVFQISSKVSTTSMLSRDITAVEVIQVYKAVSGTRQQELKCRR